MLIPGHYAVYERVNSEAQNERKWHENFFFFTKNPALANRTYRVFSYETYFGREFQEFASIFVPQNGIPSCFLFRGMVQKGIPRVFIYLCSMLQNSEHFSPLTKGLEQNSESFLFRGTHGIPPE